MAKSSRKKKTDKESTSAEIGDQVSQRMRDLRKQKNWTLEQLASLSGVSRSMLSQIERGSANPTLGIAFRIAQSLGITLDDLVDGNSMKNSIEVIRADDQRSLIRNDSQVVIRVLSPLKQEKDVEFYELLIHPDGVLKSGPHFTGTREVLVVEKGKVQLTAGDQQSILNKGDSAHYPADINHTIENIGRGKAICFLVDIYQ